MKTQEKSYTLISQNVAFNMSLRDEIDTRYLPRPVEEGQHKSLRCNLLHKERAMLNHSLFQYEIAKYYNIIRPYYDLAL